MHTFWENFLPVFGWLTGAGLGIACAALIINGVARVYRKFVGRFQP